MSCGCGLMVVMVVGVVFLSRCYSIGGSCDCFLVVMVVEIVELLLLYYC